MFSWNCYLTRNRTLASAGRTLAPEEAARLMDTLGRSTTGLAQRCIRSSGTDWRRGCRWTLDVEIRNWLPDESRTSYDRFCHCNGTRRLVWRFKAAAREIDRQILSGRWDRIAAGNHCYSYAFFGISSPSKIPRASGRAELASVRQRCWCRCTRLCHRSCPQIPTTLHQRSGKGSDHYGGKTLPIRGRSQPAPQGHL